MGGHGHGHHHDPYVVPKPEIYNNQVEKINELNYLQKELAKRGLKDPWIRLVAFLPFKMNIDSTIKRELHFWYFVHFQIICFFFLRFLGMKCGGITQKSGDTQDCVLSNLCLLDCHWVLLVQLRPLHMKSISGSMNITVTVTMDTAVTINYDYTSYVDDFS